MIQGDVRSASGRITVLGVDGGFTWLEGSIDSSDMSTKGVGGPVVVTAGAIFLESTSSITSSGLRGGGNIFVGGSYRGEGDVPTATSVLVKTGAVIDASAVTDGDGGDVVIWADDLTSYDGEIVTNGGSDSGNGGDVEVSSKLSLQQAGSIDTTAPNGADGAILIDPLYYVVMPFPEPLLSGIDDLDHLTIKSGVITDSVGFMGDYICSLFGGNCLPDDVEVGSLDVRYGSTNSIIGLLSFISKHKKSKKDPNIVYPADGSVPSIFQKYKGIAIAAQIRGMFSFVSQQTLEQYTGDVSVQSIFGITLAHGLYDSDESLDFANQTSGESVTFETMFSIQSNGDISLAGGDLTLNAGHAFDLGVIEDIIIGAIPGGTGGAAYLDLNDFLHDIDMAPIMYGILMDSFVSPTAAQDVVGFVNLTCQGCIPLEVGYAADIRFRGWKARHSQ